MADPQGELQKDDAAVEDPKLYDDWEVMDTAPERKESLADMEPDRNIALLLEKHASAIARLREDTASVGLGPEHDEIFFLRYLLSFEYEAAVEAIKWAVPWRRQPENAYWLDRAEKKMASMAKLNKADSELKINISGYHAGLKDGGPLQIVRPGLVDFGPMLEMHDHERMVMYHVSQKEVAFRMCDKQTRLTGRLVKLVVINDFTAMRMSMPPKKVMQSYSESSKLAERLYPQMLQTTVCCNPPTWFSMIMKVGKLFLSQKTLDKFKICPKSGTIDDCPFVARYMNKEEIPSFLGGPCRCEFQGGCVAGLSNDTKTCRSLTKQEIAKLKSDSVRERSEEKQKIADFVAAHAAAEENSS